jgi:hypothetical protein
VSTQRKAITFFLDVTSQVYKPRKVLFRACLRNSKKKKKKKKGTKSVFGWVVASRTLRCLYPYPLRLGPGGFGFRSATHCAAVEE